MTGHIGGAPFGWGHSCELLEIADKGNIVGKSGTVANYGKLHGRAIYKNKFLRIFNPERVHKRREGLTIITVDAVRHICSV